jgi:hypothetical protein
MGVNISNYKKRMFTEFYNNSCFYSSFIFLTNIIIAYHLKYYVFSFIFVLLLITSLIFYTYTNIYTNLLDKIPILLLFVYLLNMLYNKCKKINNNFKICLSMLIVFSFLVTNYLFYYGYIVKEYCYHKDKKIADLWHSLVHVNTSIGFNLLFLL